MDISIVLATFKRPEILHRTLGSFQSMKNGNLKWDVLVVDNAGDPETKSVVEAYRDALPIEYLVEAAPGKNRALNRAVSDVQAELVVFTDDDVICEPDWLIRLWDGAGRWPRHLVFGGRVLPFWPRGFTPHDLGNPYLVGAYAVADWDIPEGEYEPEKVFGPNMAVRKRIFDEGWRFDVTVGPSQDGNYIMGSETEFARRLDEAGHHPVYLPEALVHHQIRPGQMDFKWLKKRAYKAGRSSVLKEAGKGASASRAMGGVPRYLYRRLLESGTAYMVSTLFDRPDKIEEGMRFYVLKGTIDEYRRLAKRCR